MYFHQSGKAESGVSRRRQFNAHVGNIEHINSKTYSLLDFVKNSKKEEKSVKKQQKKTCKQNKSSTDNPPKFDEQRYVQIEKEIQELRKKLCIEPAVKDDIDNLIEKKHTELRGRLRKQILPLRVEKSEKNEKGGKGLGETSVTDKKVDENMRASSKIDENLKKSQKEKSFEIKLYSCDLTIETLLDLIAKNLSNQIELDIKYERVRNDFVLWTSQGKWQKLKNKLWEKGLLFEDVQSMKEAMYLNKKVAGLEISSWDELDGLVEKYEQAEQHWEKKVEKMVEKRQLDRLKFNAVEMDLSKKGYLSREDIACFVNLRMGKFYRGQNAETVMQRLGGEASYQKFSWRISN